MYRIAVSSQKGGVGKSSISVNLAGALVVAGHKVLLVDLDKLGVATQWLGQEDHAQAVSNVVLKDMSLEEAAQATAIEGLDVIGGGNYTDLADKQLASDLTAAFIFRERIEATEGLWDYVIFDCPPAFGTMTVNALVASTHMMIPVTLEPLAAAGFNQTLESYKVIRRHHNPALQMLGAVPNRLDRRKRAPERLLADFRAAVGDLCMTTVIRENTSIVEGFTYRQPVQKYAPYSTGTKDFRALAAELQTRVQ